MIGRKIQIIYQFIVDKLSLSSVLNANNESEFHFTIIDERIQHVWWDKSIFRYKEDLTELHLLATTQEGVKLIKCFYHENEDDPSSPKGIRDMRNMLKTPPIGFKERKMLWFRPEGIRDKYSAQEMITLNDDGIGKITEVPKSSSINIVFHQRRSRGPWDDNDKVYELRGTLPFCILMKMVVVLKIPLLGRNSNWSSIFDLFYRSSYKFFKTSGDFDCSCINSRTILEIIMRIQEKKLEFYLKFGFSVNETLKNGMTLLQWAIVNLDPKCENEQKEKLNITNESVQMEMIKLLLIRGPNVNASDIKNKTALSYAVHFANLDLIILLLEHGADINLLKLDVFPCAFKHKNVLPTLDDVENVFHILKFLISKGLDLKPADKIAIQSYFMLKNVPVDGNFDVPNFCDFANWATPDEIIINLNRMSSSVRQRSLKILKPIYLLNVHFCKDEILLREFDSIPKLLNHEEQKEIENLKKIKLQSRISLYDFLKMHPHNAFRHLNEEDIVSISEDKDFKNNFQYFGNIIRGIFARILIRKIMVEWTITFFKRMVQVDLPDLCCELILKNIKNEDLFTICCATIESCSDQDSSDKSSNQMQQLRVFLSYSACSFDLFDFLYKSVNSDPPGELQTTDG